MYFCHRIQISVRHECEEIMNEGRFDFVCFETFLNICKFFLTLRRLEYSCLPSLLKYVLCVRLSHDHLKSGCEWTKTVTHKLSVRVRECCSVSFKHLVHTVPRAVVECGHDYSCCWLSTYTSRFICFGARRLVRIDFRSGRHVARLCTFVLLLRRRTRHLILKDGHFYAWKQKVWWVLPRPERCGTMASSDEAVDC